MTMLNTLPQVDVDASASWARSSSSQTVTVKLRNPSKSLAFMTHLRVHKGATGDDVLPIFWDDNYVTLLPGEERTITGSFAHSELGTASPTVQVEGWNVSAITLNVSKHLAVKR